MNANTDPRATARGKARKLDGYTIHLLKQDGTIATVGKRRRDGTVKLTVEVRDLKGERRIPVRMARNTRSSAFGRAVLEMKAKLLRH